MKLIRLYFIVLLATTWFSETFAGAADPILFPRPAAIERDVQFWTRIFSQVDTKHGLIHDVWNLGVIYEEIRLPTGVSSRIKQRYVKKVKKRYKRILTKLAKGKRKRLSAQDKRVLSLWPKNVTRGTLRKAAKGLRFQLGQSDKFLAGLIRSGAWINHIVKTLKDMGLPTEIASLPHVESSFNPRAYSRVGAAGLWQFTRSTGRRFMRIDHVVDERMDPFKASVAAARLLKNNYAITGSWPLALTAYNHGAAGMRNAARKMGTTDITTILRRYKSRTFKFASRNFYVAFLAAVDVQHDAKKYFGTIKSNPEVKDEIVKLPAYLSVKEVSKALGISKGNLKRNNPALRPAVWNGNKHIPRGYELRLAPNSVQGSAQEAIARIAAKHLHAKQKRDKYHRVRRGQTLSVIAARYRVSVRDIVALNSLRSRNRIRVGQLLRLPARGQKVRPVRLASKTKKKPASKRITKTGKYKVRRGDSVFRIAKKFNMTEKQLLAMNHIRRKNRIYPGQLLRVKAIKPKTTRLAKAPPTKPAKKPIQVASLDKKQAAPLIEAAESKAAPKSSAAETTSTITTPVADTAATSMQATTDQVATTTTQGSGSVQTDTIAGAVSPTLSTQEPPTSSSSTTPMLENPPEQLSPAETSVLMTASPDDSMEATGGSSADLTDSPLAVAKLDNIEPDLSKVSKSNIELPPLDTLDDVFDRQNEVIASGEIAEPQNDLSADPSDYSVSKRNTIEVQAAETLGHYAEWLGIRASRLRRINKMRYRKPVVIGKRLKLDFRKVKPDEFERQRKEYHRALQGEFFERFQIVGSKQHRIRRGDSLWVLAKRKYRVPMWLVRQYNPDLDLSNVRRGSKVTFPKLEPRDKPAEPEAAATSKRLRSTG